MKLIVSAILSYLPKLDLAVLVEILACTECAAMVMEVIRMHLREEHVGCLPVIAEVVRHGV